MHLWRAQAGTPWPPGKLTMLQKGSCALLSCHCCARYPNTALFEHVRIGKCEVPNTTAACQAYVAWCHPALSQVEEMKAANQFTNQDHYIQTVIRKKLPTKQRIAMTASHLELDLNLLGHDSAKHRAFPVKPMWVQGDCPPTLSVSTSWQERLWELSCASLHKDLAHLAV